jgi:predicted MPP superfamily phosphohydrolase
MISRRALLRSALLGGSAAGVGLLHRDLEGSGWTGDFITEQIHVPVPDLPPAFDGYRVGFLTDLHLGVWVPDGWIHRAIEEISRYDIDILLLGGDYILVNEMNLWQECGIVRNETFAHLSKTEAIPSIYSAFGRCFIGRRFRDGLYGVVGNHDHWNSFSTFQQIMREYPDVRILINEEVVISRGEQSLCLFGVDDYLTGLPSTPPPRELRPGISSRIILSHNPDYIAALLKRPEYQFSLALCGHTHGGQIVLPVLGPVAAQVVDRRFISGMQTIGNTHIYTSRGLGVVGLPFRVNCPAEVTVFTLRRA